VARGSGPDPHGVAATRSAVEAVWRIERARVLATLVRFTGDIGTAEELLGDALVAALEQWPEGGVPSNPAAWLTSVAKKKAIDGWRRHSVLAGKYALLASGEADEPDALAVAAEPDEIDDDLLRLIFTACHPVLPGPSRVALTLRLLGGLTTDEIARGFLVPTATIAQRITRAKKTITAARVPFEVPERSELAPRLDAVLGVIYLVFNEGYSATAGDDWIRPTLCNEALRLARVLAGLVPREAEAHALLALLEFQGSRLAARVSPAGDPVLLDDQDRARWDRLQIRRGVAALARADALAAPRGVYALQAAIARCHATAVSPEETDWAEIVALYDALASITSSPVVELNRAVALSRAGGTAAALDLVDLIAPRLAGYHLLPVVRGDLLAKLGRPAEARGEFLRAAELTRNEREREMLVARAATFVGG
jgi:RNA polymerase sigma factor (sigma-70 family)